MKSLQFVVELKIFVRKGIQNKKSWESRRKNSKTKR
jgi:hypothetical protein